MPRPRRDNEDEENDYEGKQIGGLISGSPKKLARRAPREPARTLPGRSLSAYTPFKGLPTGWMSVVYDDAATYEGTEYAGMPHGKGVLYVGLNGGGAGIEGLEAGDRYEGEFHHGFADGLGMLTKESGTVYRGEFLVGKLHGCGVELDLSPYYEAIADGDDPDEAWEKTKDAVASRTRRGTFRRDMFVSGPSDGGSGGGAGDEDGFCSSAEIAGTVEEVQHVVARARMFEHKPDGAVAISATQDGRGLPAPLMQDPLHYPFATKWMAPGPLGQCFRLPDDEKTLEALDDAARNHELIWREFNLPRVIEPGTDMAEAVKLAGKVASVRLRHVEPRVVLDQAEDAFYDALDEAEARAADAKAAVSEKRREARRAQRISDDDLVADASGVSSTSGGSSSSSRSGSSSGSSGRSGGSGSRSSSSSSSSVFGSMTASFSSRRERGFDLVAEGREQLSSLATALGRAVGSVASSLPVGGRRGLSRPSERRE